MKKLIIGLFALVAVVAISGCTTGSLGGMLPGAADISEVMVIWELEFIDAEGQCLRGGGDWHNDSGWWGCEGAGPAGAADCTNQVARAAERMCEGMHATWKCDRNDVYCKY